jgi:hypothetical protein
MTTRRIDPGRIHVKPLAERRSLLEIERIACDPDATALPSGELAPQLDLLAERIVSARQGGAAVMLTFGAHLVKNGAGPLVNRLVERGWLTHLATHGAGVIHDWEFAATGRSSESVAENAPAGTFGCWDETGKWLNLSALSAAADGIGWGEGVGRMICDDGITLPEPDELSKRIASEPDGGNTAALADLLAFMKQHNLPGGRHERPHPFKRYSIPAACHQAGAAFTVHPGIGYDIYANHPMFHAGAVGRASGRDFHAFVASVENLTGGVYLSVGSAIMSPQVFEKAFSAANNLRRSDGRATIDGHTIGVVDIQDSGGWDWSAGEPPMDHPAYYLRFCKSFYRMGGRIEYLRGDNRLVLANLLERLKGQTP